MKRIGSLFSGYGGLDLGVQAVLGGEIAWHVEYDEAPSKILDHHWPAIPNYGDVTKVDWSRVEPIDVLTGGFPCQDLSLAGRRAGMRDGTRSGLWADYLTAITKLQPELVVIENVRGLLSGCAESEADSELGPCPRCLDSGTAADHAPNIRALGRVLGDLAGIGYDAEWIGVPASAAGAPHGRFRVFILAHPEGKRWGVEHPAHERSTAGNVHSPSHQTAVHASAAAPDSGSSRGRESASAADQRREGPERTDLALERGEGHRTVPDSVSDPAERRRADRHLASSAGEHAGPPEQRKRHGDAARDRGAADVSWGQYEPAIRRWEHALGRLAPAPTAPDGRDDQHRLSAPFVEWMMGLPSGWVTDPLIGLTRNQQLRALGNGVVPQQAALAVTTLLQRRNAA